MMEQKARFAAAGFDAVFVGEGQKDASVWRRVISGDVQLVYVSPENIICNARYRQMLQTPEYKENLVCIAVDEAHCVKTW